MNYRRLIQVVLLLALLSPLAFLFKYLTLPAKAGINEIQEGSAREGGSRLVHMPLVAKAYPRRASLFGVEMYNMDSSNGFDAMLSAGAYWIRRNALLWSQAEPTQGNYYPYSQPVLREELMAASNLGVEVLLIVRSAPDWARQIASKDCSRIKSDKLQAFADFMKWAVERYSSPPYNVKYWQIWNEPDVPPSVAVPGGINGCWGDPNDDYYGGGYYAEVLKAVYPKVKEANPEAQVLLGGLLLDCNPSNPNCVDPRQSRYLEGILANGGGDYFDAVAFNAYDYYDQSRNGYINTNWSSSWDTTGPVVIAKAEYIRNLLGEYNVQGKTLINTEGAILCGQSGQEPHCLTSTFEEIKANYVAQLFAAALAEGFESSIWYNALGWRGSGLFDTQLTPLPAYDAYRFAANKLTGAEFIRKISEYPGIMGYEFNREGRTLWVLWALGDSVQTVNLPSMPSGIWDALGTPISVFASIIEVTRRPLYIEYVGW